MDPDRCLRDLLEARYVPPVHTSAYNDHVRDLKGWLARGGFAPNWQAVVDQFLEDCDFVSRAHVRNLLLLNFRVKVS